MSGNYTYLMHHGIKGQEWGVQNGPPYPLDEKTKAIAYRGGYLKDGTKVANATKKEVRQARQQVNKNIKFMSTNDLNEYKNRLMLEESLEDITGTNWYKKQGKQALNNINRILTEGSVDAGKTIVKNSELYAASEALSSMLGKTKVDPTIAETLVYGRQKDKKNDNPNNLPLLPGSFKASKR